MRVLQQDLCCSCRSQAAEDGCVTPAASAGAPAGGDGAGIAPESGRDFAGMSPVRV